MKRSALLPGKPPCRKAALARGAPLAKRGARAKREEVALIAFRCLVRARALYACERCGVAPSDTRRLHAHHLLPRSRGGTHTPENGACLCIRRHRSVHDHTFEDWSDWIRGGQSKSLKGGI